MIRSELQSLLKRVYLNGLNDYVTIQFINSDSSVSSSFTTSGSVMYGQVVGTMTGLPTSTIVINNLNEVINTLNSFSEQIITQYGANYLIVSDNASEIPPVLNLELVSLSLPQPIKTPEEIQVERLPEEGGVVVGDGGEARGEVEEHCGFGGVHNALFAVKAAVVVVAQEGGFC